ncbi:hypothetical protein pdam_00022852 [Pocillopora damicornis]|uniref:Uncharacterized protein n=1 Tax=Pocillopora damicornis TaxID=46731 RepID=A0A3M6TR26_POCDA|nr:hypothetical protein pdam_00022852 [Pocillopora damicornis]
MQQFKGGAIPKNRRNTQISKNVLLLKKNDFHNVNGGTCMPTQSEMSTIKRSDHLKQFKRNLEFDADMSDDMVKEHLEATFPYLKGRRFSCAAVVRIDRDRSKFEYYGHPRVWDSNFIRTKIKGNSTLYLLESLDSERGAVTGLCKGFDVANVNGAISDEQQILNDSTSGISESDNVVSEVSKEPGWVTITLRADQSPYEPVLGRTRIYYERSPREEFLEEIVFNFDEQKELYETLIRRRSGSSGNRESGDSGGGNSGGLNKGYGKQISEAFGSSQLPHVLSILIYTAARHGAKEFIEIVFNSSAGGVVFNSYKDNATLPESVARDSGNDEIANYLEEITKRFSQEIQNGKQFSQTVDWLELVKATEEAQTKMNQDTDKKHANQVESGYSADIDSSSSAVSDQEDSDCGVPPNLDRGEDEIEKESVISKGSSEKTFTSSTVMSRRTKDSARGSIVGEIDEAAEDVKTSLDSFETTAMSSCGNFAFINIQFGIHRGSLREPKAHNGQVRGVAIDNINQQVMTTGADCKLKFWSDTGTDADKEFGDVKEITTEGNHTSSASDNRADYKNLDQISDGRAPPSFLSNSRWRLTNSSTQIKIGEQTTGAIIAAPFFLPTTQELVPKFFQTEEDQTDEEDAKPKIPDMKQLKQYGHDLSRRNCCVL